MLRSTSMAFRNAVYMSCYLGKMLAYNSLPTCYEANFVVSCGLFSLVISAKNRNLAYP